MLVCLPSCQLLIVPTDITHKFETFVVMETSQVLLGNGELDYRRISKLLYRDYEDEFDLILIVSNVPSKLQDTCSVGYSGRMNVIRNSVTGDGVTDLDRGIDYGSAAKLKGIIHLASIEHILDGTLLHEIMHLWVWNVEVIPTNFESHWGFSSVNGYLGGFDASSLVDLGEGKYRARWFRPNLKTEWGPYSPLEMYLAGWLPSKRVPDILIAEDASTYVERRNGTVVHRLFDGRFTSTGVSNWTIEQVIERIGERKPDVDNSQRAFRLATIVLVNEDFPLRNGDVELLTDHLELFTRNESVQDVSRGRGAYNFHDATEGQASMRADLVSARRITKVRDRR
jgi:hypothetical protein